MGISRKIALLQSALIISFLGIILFMSQQVWGQNYLKLEQDDVKDNVIRTYYAWGEELNFLGSLVGDWAPWDDLFAFANNPQNNEFVEKNLPDVQMANLRINMAIVTDPDGKILFAKAIDLEQKTESEIPKDALDHISKLINTNILGSGDDKSIKTFIVVDEQPLLFAMQRILTSDKQGPSPGVFVFAKFADEALLEEISKRTQVQVAFEKEAVLSKHLKTGAFYQDIIGDATIKAYYPLQDAFGNTSFLVSTMPRLIYQQGQAQMKSFLIFIIVFGGLFICITLFLLDRVILLRVRKMDSFMNSIITDNNYSNRLDLSGNDELSKAAAAMNNMLHQIEISQKKITGLYETVRTELDERRRAEQNLRYLSMHDPLTGLFNRTYFEQEIASVIERQVQGVGVVCCDLDGLKLINDTMGHLVGDKILIEAARILSRVFENNGVVARIGGDEFAVILSNVGEEVIQQACQQIKDIEIQNPGGLGVPLNLSFGWAYYGGNNVSESILRDLIKQADDLMYRQKLSSSQSNRSMLVQGMLELLKARDFITEGHSQRLQQYAVSLGRLVGLREDQMADLCLLAQFHDVGKVGISDAILFKPGPLSAEERKEMERHSEIGHRIAQAIPELLPIGEYILKHHEWWNGKGYPFGLTGNQIPIEDRILSIADAFDAMTSNRPYRQAMSVDDALSELRRYAGIQFDPDLVEKFISIVLQSEKLN